jgi:hypothetical protein
MPQWAKALPGIGELAMQLRTVSIVRISALLSLVLALVVATSIEAQAPKGYVRDLPADPAPRFVRPEAPKPAKPERTTADEMSEAVKGAMANAETAESEYRKAIDANRKQPGAVADGDVERLHQIYSDSLLSATSQQVKFLQADVDRLREQVDDLRRVKFRPVGNSASPTENP